MCKGCKNIEEQMAKNLVSSLKSHVSGLFVLLLVFQPAIAFDHSFADYDSVLKRYVAEGRVDYLALRADRSHVDSFLNVCATLSFEEYQTFQRDQQLAFMINFYNAAALALVCDHPEITSVNEFKTLFGDVWSIKFSELFEHTVSLGMILHDVLRPEFHDTRIHFALVTACRSDPELLDTPYRAEVLSQQLERQTDKFMLERPDVNRYSDGVLHLSPLFKWYAVDFGNRKDVLRFAARYFPEVNTETRLQYSAFDWSLNAR